MTAKIKLPVVGNVEARQRKMIKEFQCPGCTCGNDPSDCGRFKLDGDLGQGFHCSGHSAGTFKNFVIKLALGLPKGFNQVGILPDGHSTNIRLYLEGATTHWDRLNVPVWAMKEGKYTFVRTFSPRINIGWIDVIENGPPPEKIVPNAGPLPIDVAHFIEEID